MAINLGSAFGKVSIDSSGVVAGVALAKSALSGMRDHFNTVAADLRDAGLKMSVAITLPLVGIGKAGLDAASEFETGMSRIEGLAGATKEEIEKMGPAILALSQTYARSPRELADAMFMIRSAGFQGKTGLDILEAAARASAAGLGPTNVLADGLTSILKAYPERAGNAGLAMDVFTNIVVQSKRPPEELAASFGRVLPLASKMGVSFEEIGAFAAVSTQKGLNFDETMTALRATLGDLEKPGTAAKEMLRDLGTSADEVKKEIREKGLMATLLDLTARTERLAGTTVTLTGKTKDNTLAIEKQNNSMTKTREAITRLSRDIGVEEKAIADAGAKHLWKADVMATHERKLADMKVKLGDENRQLELEKDALGKASKGTAAHTAVMGDSVEMLGKIFPNIRALTGVLSTAGDKTGTYAQILDDLNKKSLGKTAKAFEAAQKDIGFQIEKVQNTFKVLAAMVGLEILPKITPFIKMFAEQIPLAFAKLREAWDALSPQFKAAALAFGAVAVAAGPIMLALGGVATVIGVLLSPVGAVVLAVGLLAAAWATDFMGIREKTQQAIAFIVPVIQNGLAAIRAFWAANGSQIIATVSGFFAQVQAFFRAAMAFIVPLIQGALAGIRTFWAQHGSQIIATVQQMWATVQGAFQTVIAFIVPLIRSALAGIQAFWAAHGAEIMATVENFMGTVQGAIAAAMAFIQPLVQGALAGIQNWWAAHGANVMVIVDKLVSTVQKIVAEWLAQMEKGVSTVLGFIAGFWKEHGKTIEGIVDTLWKNLKNVFDIGVALVTGIVDLFAAAIKGDTQGMKDAVSTMIDKMWANVKELFERGKENALKAMTALKDAIGGLAGGFLTEAGKVGGSIVEGIKKAMSDKIDELSRWVADQMRKILQSAKDAIGMQSPSKEFMKVGESIGEGMALGVTNSMGKALAATRSAMRSLVFAGSGLSLAGAGVGAGAGGNTYHSTSSQTGGAVSATFNVYDAGEMNTALAWVEQQRAMRLNATMGG